MGTIQLKRGHQALLPKGAAYRFKAARPSVMIQQTIKGAAYGREVGRDLLPVNRAGARAIRDLRPQLPVTSH